MANLGLSDVLVRSENKTLLPIFNRLRQRNDIMSHLQWKEASHKTYHRFLHRSSEPSGSFVALGEGISGSRPEVGVVIEPRASSRTCRRFRKTSYGCPRIHSSSVLMRMLHF